MKKILILFISLLTVHLSHSQTAVTDKANDGQLKRMIAIQWDDWQPDPGTHSFWFVEIPNNLEGYIYWRWLHPDYYFGEDRRPYRTSGPFSENYASLILQSQNDKAIADTSNAVMQTNMATYINMSGGDLDVTYSMYFQDQFDKLNKDLTNFLGSISNTDPGAYDYIFSSQQFQDYVEYAEQINDRISAIHNAFVDKGDRINAYLEIIKEWTKKNTYFKKTFALLKGQYDEKQAAKDIQPFVATYKIISNVNIPAADKHHVKTILKNFRF